MVEDTKMTDKAQEEPKEEEKKVDTPKAPPLPPLQAAARRLEKSLGAGAGTEDKDRFLHAYINPTKVVRRWLGTSSGASGEATLEGISQAAEALLDP